MDLGLAFDFLLVFFLKADFFFGCRLTTFFFFGFFGDGFLAGLVPGTRGHGRKLSQHLHSKSSNSLCLTFLDRVPGCLLEDGPMQRVDVVEDLLPRGFLPFADGRPDVKAIQASTLTKKEIQKEELLPSKSVFLVIPSTEMV